MNVFLSSAGPALLMVFRLAASIIIGDLLARWARCRRAGAVASVMSTDKRLELSFGNTVGSAEIRVLSPDAMLCKYLPTIAMAGIYGPGDDRQVSSSIRGIS